MINKIRLVLADFFLGLCLGVIPKNSKEAILLTQYLQKYLHQAQQFKRVAVKKEA